MSFVRQADLVSRLNPPSQAGNPLAAIRTVGITPEPVLLRIVHIRIPILQPHVIHRASERGLYGALGMARAHALEWKTRAVVEIIGAGLVRFPEYTGRGRHRRKLERGRQL